MWLLSLSCRQSAARDPFESLRTRRRLISPALLHRLFEHDVHHLVKGLCFVWFDDGSETSL
jgi:hypothetical protein